ncbi:GDSL esterase/lipase At5g03980-like [Apium graveolens]|uniref:GDSL esterase/lipase At5g03980-like n=1 Tax=Apium graveolens TaxID=4045 RepID=UPI003D7BFC3D
MVGEIGRNDYSFAFQQGKTFEEAKTLVPEVIDIIKNAVKLKSFYMFRRVVNLGATQVIVPGVFPLGCFPSYLKDFKSNDESAYDEHYCLKEFNDFIAFHNKYLQQTIITLQEEYPRTTIVYADYYDAFKWLLYNAWQLGFDATSTLEGCCGNSGPSRTSASSVDGCGCSNIPQQGFAEQI